MENQNGKKLSGVDVVSGAIEEIQPTLSPQQMIDAVRVYLETEDLDIVSRHTGLDPETVLQLVRTPDVVNKVVQAKQTMFRLAFWAKVPERLLSLLLTTQSTREAASLAKVLREMLETAGSGEEKTPEKKGDVNLAVLVQQSGGYDTLVRKLESLSPAAAIQMLQGETPVIDVKRVP